MSQSMNTAQEKLNRFKLKFALIALILMGLAFVYEQYYPPTHTKVESSISSNEDISLMIETPQTPSSPITPAVKTGLFYRLGEMLIIFIIGLMYKFAERRGKPSLIKGNAHEDKSWNNSTPSWNQKNHKY